MRIPVVSTSFPNHRPDHYGPDITPEYSLAGRVRGTWRRLAIQNAYDSGTVDEVPDEVFRETLPQEEIDGLTNGPKPNHISGERLPELERDEVEIVRIIYWVIRLAPVIAIYARPLGEGRGYAIRIVNEIHRPVTNYPPVIPRTLYFRELIELLNKARIGDAPAGLIWPLAVSCVRRGLSVSGLVRGGIYPVSAFYPYLRPAFQAAFQNAFQANFTCTLDSSAQTETTNSDQEEESR